MSFNNSVPLLVPSLRQSSTPAVPSVARTIRVSATLAKNPSLVLGDGREPLAPGQMSRTRTVPLLEPLLFQSSLPAVPLLAAKKSVPLTLVRNNGLELPAPAWMSLTRTVLLLAPSL